MTNSPRIDQKNNFQVFLEGVQVPFSDIKISEAEGAFPTASISFPASKSALRILPATIVQIFGEYNNETLLLFEGEVTGLSYSRGPAGRQATIMANSLLSSFYKATIRPQDGLITDRLRKQLGGRDVPTSISAKLTNSVGISSSITNEYMKTWQAQSKPVISDSLQNMVVLSPDNLVFNFLGLMNVSYIRRGDFHPIPQFFLRYFEMFDPYFGIQSLSYGLTKSVFTLPNPAKVTPFLNKLAVATLNHVFTMPTNVNLALMDVLNRFMAVIAYSSISPAAYTASKIFWGPVSDLSYEVPLRTYFLPDLVNSPPARCNIIFPSQNVSFMYERDMTAEATRVIGEMGLPFNAPPNLPKGSQRTHVIPDINYTIDSKRKISGGLTIEESYRGINPGYVTMDPFLSAAVYADKEGMMVKYNKLNSYEKPKDPTSSENWEEKVGGNKAYVKGFETSFEQMVTKSYLQYKYGKRGCTVGCDWSPYRMVGVPGLILDDKGPSVFGVVSAINIAISANGMVSSTISFRNPRLIFDDEWDDAFKIPSKTIDNYLINDFTNDGALSINKFLFDPALYEFTTMGKTLYTYLITGRDHKTAGTFKDLATNNGIYKRFEGSLNSKNWELAEGDASIFYFITDPETATFTTAAQNFANDSPNEEVRNAKLLYYACHKLKADFNEKLQKYSGDELAEYVDDVTKRNIITKSEYFKFIGVTTGAPVKSQHYKDSTAIFTSPEAVIAFKNEYDKIRSLKDFINEAIEYPALDNLASGTDVTALDSQLSRMKLFNKSLESWLRIVISTHKTKSSGGITIEIDPNAMPIDITSFGDRELYQKEESINAFFEEEEIGQDSFTVYYFRYKANTEAAQKDLTLRKKLVEAAETDISSYKSGEKVMSTTLDSKIFAPYNLIRYAHVKKAFEPFLRQKKLLVVKN